VSSQINAVLRAVLEGSFPDVAWRDELGCGPILDEGVGELSSGAALEVAKHRRVDVKEVGEVFLKRLRAEMPGEWRLENGYLVLDRAPLAIVTAEAEAWRSMRRASGVPDKIPQVIIGVADDTTLPLYVRMRVAGLAALQGWLAATYGGGATVGIGGASDVSEIDASRCSDIVQHYTTWLHDAVRGASDPQRPPLRLGGSLSDVSQRKEFLWMARGTYERLSPRERMHIREQRERGGYSVRIPADGWLVSRERTLAEVLSPRALSDVVERIASADTSLMWLFHVASPTPSSDFDPYVALVDESSSLLWNLRALANRFQSVVSSSKLFSSSSVGTLADEALSLDNAEWMNRERFPWQRLVMHGEWIGYWIERAVMEGDMESFGVVLEQLCRWGHRYLNAPQTRHWLASGEDSSLHTAIVSSLRDGLSTLGYLQE
jgi:hypothetical protein